MFPLVSLSFAVFAETLFVLVVHMYFSKHISVVCFSHIDRFR